ncbi:DUF5690 family protein [Thermoflexibacter ruber]|uniref:Sugar phosphate permease n=1 Tax=Thermoflexibacter ruber TaxID=1003 RepID=A0A1I2E0Z5_9BACT|nr:DUF5690 family protein [Thermoflexibacter ruber]SFE86369.1 hypothetical protein SAMN04488541_1008107 [Thermoflexibacter ruber]
MTIKNRWLSQWLVRANPFFFSVYASLVAFCAYTCIFAFRKPFTVATFEGVSLWGVDYKIWLISAQVIGYMISKFIGIKVIAEMSGEKRALGILVMVVFAGFSLLGFAFVAPPYNIIFMFLNGLPLGMGWGFMLGYLEGRRVTEVLSAGLSVSFIFSSGFSKSIGKWVMEKGGFSEYTMPLVVASLFAIPLVFFVYLLDHLPPPSAIDEAYRTKRQPMNAKERINFVKTFLGGLILLIVSYIFLTIYREFRDNYAAEIWQALGYGSSANIFTLTETPVALCVMICVSLVMAVKDNKNALIINHIMIFAGFLLIGLSTFAFQQTWISPVWWIILVGLGLYLGYVPFNSVLFDRLIATFRYVSNVGFLIYLADSFGYLGSISVLFYKNFGQLEVSWLAFFINISYIVSIVGSLLMLASLGYFLRKYQIQFSFPKR